MRVPGFHPLSLLAFVMVSTLTTPVSANAQNRTVMPADSVAQEPAVSKNPTFLFRTLSFSQEWNRLSPEGHTVTTTLGYTEPFRHASASIGVSVPLVIPERASGKDQSVTPGDVAFKSQWIPYLNPNHGVLLSTSLTLPTSGDARVGDGNWMVTPSVAYARFWGPRLLVAQFFQQQFSVSRQASRSPVNRSDLDLYTVFSGRSLRWWINADLNLRIDEANHNKTPSSATISYGRGLRKVLGGSLNGSLQSGAGIGRDRPYDFMVSGGISLVGFHLGR